MIIYGQNMRVGNQRLYSAHVMIAFTGFCPDLNVWFSSMKAAGYNNVWAFMDAYEGNYIADTQAFLDAALIASIPVILGTQGGTGASQTLQLMQDTINHPAVFRIGTKKVYADYDHQPSNYDNVVAGLSGVGINRSDYLLWSMTHYPVYEYWLTPPVWLDNFFGFPNISVDQVDRVYDSYLHLDGIINFSVDKGSSGTDEVRTPDLALDHIIIENNFISDSSKRYEKTAMAGINAFYASAQFTDFGYKGTALIWQAIIDMAVSDRPFAVQDTTADDYVELSYMSPMLMPPVNGLSRIPEVNRGFFLGSNTRETLLDHSGIQKFLRPWIDAYLSDSATVTFSTERIFSWYWLHPSDAALIPTIPAAVSALNSTANENKYHQAWWDSTVWASGSGQVDGIKFFISSIDTIRMAAHLTSSGYLKINSTLSTLQSAGAAYFEIPVSSFRGTPTFSIIAADGTTVRKTGDGLQAISDSCYPGGWNFLATEN